MVWLITTSQLSCTNQQLKLAISRGSGFFSHGLVPKRRIESEIVLAGLYTVPEAQNRHLKVPHMEVE